MRRSAIINLIVPATIATASSAARLAAIPQTEQWKGSIALPGATLDFAVRFTPDQAAAGGWAAELDIPMQGVTNAAMSDVVYTETELGFTFGCPGAVFSGVIDSGRRCAVFAVPSLRSTARSI